MYPPKYPDETEKRYQQRILETFEANPKLHKNENWIDLICSYFRPLPYKFMIKYADVLDWNELCRSQHLSNDFMDLMFDYMDWSTISWGQKLTEWFMEKHADHLNWYSISGSQKMSDDFLIKHFDKIDLIQLMGNKKTKASESFWRTALTMNPDHIIQCMYSNAIKFDVDFIREFRDRFKNLHNLYINFDHKQKAKINKEFNINLKCKRY